MKNDEQERKNNETCWKRSKTTMKNDEAEREKTMKHDEKERNNNEKWWKK